MIIIGIDPQKLVYTPARSSLPRIVGSTRWRFEATLGRLPSPTQVAVGFDERRWAVAGLLSASAAVLAWAEGYRRRRLDVASRAAGPVLTILVLAAVILFERPGHRSAAVLARRTTQSSRLGRHQLRALARCT